jgi:hypothetical protein
MKTANNFFEMCQLSRSCIDVVGNYEYKPAISEKKSQKMKKTKK